MTHPSRAERSRARTVLVVLAGFALLACGRRENVQAQETPDETIQSLAAEPHGLVNLTPQGQERFDRVRRDPLPYVGAARARYGAHPLASLAPAERRRLGAVAGILGQLAVPEAADLLAVWFLELDTDVVRGADGMTVTLADMRASVLSALRGHRRDAVVTRILDRLPALRGAEQYGALYYLITATSQDEVVIARLNSLYSDPSSSLYGDATLAKVIDSLKRGVTR